MANRPHLSLDAVLTFFNMISVRGSSADNSFENVLLNKQYEGNRIRKWFFF